AMAGRSQHRSQDEGQLERPGPSVDRLAFLEWRERGRGTGDGDGVFSGVDTLPPTQARYAALIDSARARLNPSHPEVIVPLLARARRAGHGRDPALRRHRRPRRAALATVFSAAAPRRCTVRLGWGARRVARTAVRAGAAAADCATHRRGRAAGAHPRAGLPVPRSE